MERQISKKYMDYLIPIVVEGVDGFVWKKEQVLAFLNDGESNYFAVMGGDVLRVSIDGTMEYTYDSWSVSPSRHPQESFADFVNRCKTQTQKYVQEYTDQEDLVFSRWWELKITEEFLKFLQNKLVLLNN